MLYAAFSLSGTEFEVGLQFEVGLLFWGDAFGDGLDFDAAFFGFGGDLASGVDFFGLGGDLDFGVDFVFVGDFFGVDFFGEGLRVYCRAISSRLLSSSSNDEICSYSDPSSEHELGDEE